MPCRPPHQRLSCRPNKSRTNHYAHRRASQRSDSDSDSGTSKQAPGRGKQSESNKTTREKKEVTSASGRLDELACIAFGPVVLHAPVHQQREAHFRLPHGLPAARDTAVQRSAPLLTRRPICIVHESGHAMPTHHRAPIGHPLTNPASFNQHQPTPSATPHPSPISINNSRFQGANRRLPD
ncbi:hypothetical protein CABS01_06274 [Colletotrichum abscissum]|uniref:uncharacterized protein n=1 Tax=Colletotrichum abscissum TaxID=1671311 RepID=UPI0027D6C4A1|nr:uncharacterized protein CABS01_06274 [Colletotrichum abscissum]KAK1516307.1 hypothetical protein CABS01_06274 [Colletotrichum abscissum]